MESLRYLGLFQLKPQSLQEITSIIWSFEYAINLSLLLQLCWMLIDLASTNIALWTFLFLPSYGSEWPLRFIDEISGGFLEVSSCSIIITITVPEFIKGVVAPWEELWRLTSSRVNWGDFLICWRDFFLLA